MINTYYNDYSKASETGTFLFTKKWKKWYFFIDNLNYQLFPIFYKTYPNLFDNPTTLLKKEIARLPKDWKERPIVSRIDFYGSRNNGKTYNIVLYQWYLKDLFSSLKISNVWTRVKLKECRHIFKTILMLSPDKLKERLNKKGYENKYHRTKLKISNTDLICEYGNISFEIINIIGKNDSIKQEDHSLAGYEVGECNIRFLMYEESYRMNPGMRASASIICRNQDVLIICNILNNYSYNSKLVKELDEYLPFDAYKMGKNYISKIDDYKDIKILNKVQGFQYKYIEDEERSLFKFNHVLLYKAGMMKFEDVKKLWIEAKRDFLRKDIILWGKTGSLESGMFTNYIKKIKKISIEQNIKDFRTDPLLIYGYFFVGIDLGYTHDKTVATIVVVSKDFSKVRLISTKIIKAKTTALDMEEQMFSIVDFVQKQLKMLSKSFCEYWVSANTVHAIQLSIETKFNKVFGNEKFYFYNFKRPLPLLERTNFLKTLISNSKFEMVDSVKNNNLIIELENITYGNIDIPSHTKRIGEDDIIEAFENAIFPVFSNLKFNLYNK